MAIGKCFDSPIVPATTDATINGCAVIRGGVRVDFDDATVRGAMAADTVDVTVRLGDGPGSATAYGCDLSSGYIHENAAYYSS
jgi:glutamate N-acetyltransferase/amino-acid N-acetyltransferase